MTSISNTNRRLNSKVMNRFDLTKRLVSKLSDEAVIGGIGNTNFDLWSTGQRRENFYMLGSMGLAVPIGLGVALAQPTRRAIALEGDGSLLMQLGSLATVAHLAPKNLCIIVMDNGIYQITGSQQTATSLGADIVDIARGAGLSQSIWAGDEADFDAIIDRALTSDGPWLIAARIDGQPGVAQTERDPSQIRDRFMRGMNAKQSSALSG